ncbi:hypothetical protein [Spirochaeta dissipatitropha]
MKKIALILIVMALCVLGGSVFSQDTDTLLFLEGVGSSLDGQKVDNMPMASQVDYIHKEYGDASSQVIIGQSMGGLRALGYAGLKGQSNDVKAAIAITAPVRGYSALSRGSSVLAAQLNSVYRTFDMGFRSFQSMGKNTLNSSTVISKGVSDGLAGMGFSAEAGPAAMVENLVASAGVADLHPESDFIRSAISDIDWDYHEYTLFGRLIRIRIPGTRAVIPGIPETIYVGQIVGKQNHPRHLIVDHMGSDNLVPPVNLGPLGEFNVVSNNAALRAGHVLVWGQMASAQSYWTGRSAQERGLAAVAWGAFWNRKPYHTHIRRANRYQQYAGYAANARAWMDPNQITKRWGDLIGQQESDGFITANDQYWPLNEIGGRPIPFQNGHVELDTINHASALWHEDVWGEGATQFKGMNGGEIEEGGVLYEFLDRLRILGDIAGTMKGDIVK